MDMFVKPTQHFSFIFNHSFRQQSGFGRKVNTMGQIKVESTTFPLTLGANIPV